MLNWFKHKNYPSYYQDYLNHFKTSKETDINGTRFVVFDTETTGLNPAIDKILSIGCVSVIGNVIDVAKSFEIYVKQDKFNVETVEIHGILKEGNITKIQEKEALIQFLAYIKDAILVAHHAAFDIAMVNTILKRLGLPKLKNKVLDTGFLYKKTSLCKKLDKHYSLDELCDVFNIKKHDRHTASGDAYISALIFLKIIADLKKRQPLTLKKLFFNSNRRGLV